jgi:lipid-binding SYLF domain-containing protein
MLAFYKRDVFTTTKPFKLKGSQMLRKLLGIIVTTGILASCSSYNQASDADKIDAAVTATLFQLFTTYPSAERLAQNAEATLVIPRMSQGGFIIGGGYGRGALQVDNVTKAYFSATKGSIGLQAGSQQFSHVMFFMTGDAVSDFLISPGWSAGGSVQYVVSDQGDGWSADLAKAQSAIIAVSFNQSGLGAAATLEGMKYTQIYPE